MSNAGEAPNATRRAVATAAPIFQFVASSIAGRIRSDALGAEYRPHIYREMVLGSDLMMSGSVKTRERTQG